MKKKKKPSAAKLLTGEHIKGLDKKDPTSKYGDLFANVDSQMKKLYPNGGVKGKLSTQQLLNIREYQDTANTYSEVANRENSADFGPGFLEEVQQKSINSWEKLTPEEQAAYQQMSNLQNTQAGHLQQAGNQASARSHAELKKLYPHGGESHSPDFINLPEQVATGSDRFNELTTQQKDYETKKTLYDKRQTELSPYADVWGDPTSMSVGQFTRRYPDADADLIPEGATSMLEFRGKEEEIAKSGFSGVDPTYSTGHKGKTKNFFYGYDAPGEAPAEFEVFDQEIDMTIAPEDGYEAPVEEHKTKFIQQKPGTWYKDSQGNDVQAPKDSIWQEDTGVYYDPTTGKIFNPRSGETTSAEPDYDPTKGTMTTVKESGVPDFEGGGSKEGYYTSLGEVLRENFGQENLAEGGEQKITQTLTGETIKELNPNKKIAANAEIEDGEYVKFPDGVVQKGHGEKHSNGGIDMHIPDGTKILSNKRKLTSDQVKKLKEDFDIKVSTKDTYSKALDKYVDKIGLRKLYDEQEELFESLEKVVNDSQSEGSSRVNKEYLSKKISQIEAQKTDKEKLKLETFDKVFTMQEVGKRGEESQDVEQFFKDGGISRDAFQKVVNKYGLSEKEGIELYKGNTPERLKESYQDGGKHKVKSRQGARANEDGSESSHLMKREYVDGKGWVAFPTLFQDEDGTWVDTFEKQIQADPKNWEGTYQEAVKRGEVYEFGDNEQGAIDFADKGSWKKDKKYPHGGEHKEPKSLKEVQELYLAGDISREEADQYEVSLANIEAAPPVKFTTTLGNHEFSDTKVYAREKQPAGEVAFGKITKESLPNVLNNLYRNFPDIVAEEYGVTYNEDGTIAFNEDINFAEASEKVKHFQEKAQGRMEDTASMVIDNPDSFSPEYVKSAEDYLTNETFDGSLARGLDSKLGQFTSGRYSLGINVVTPEEKVELETKGIFTTKQLQESVDSGEVELSKGSLGRLEKIRTLTPEGTDPDFSLNTIEALPTLEEAPVVEEVPAEVPDPEKGIEDDIVVPGKKYPQLFMTPDQSPLPPSAMEAHLMGSIRLERIDPVRIGVETELQQASDAIKEGTASLDHLPPNQRAAAIVGLQANVQKGINEAIHKANIVNAENQASAELFNIGQSGQEEQLKLSNLLSFEQRQLTAKAKTEEEVRNYYDQLNRIKVNNFRNQQDLNLIQTLAPDYSLNTTGTGVDFTPEGEFKLEDRSKYKDLFQ